MKTHTLRFLILSLSDFDLHLIRLIIALYDTDAMYNHSLNARYKRLRDFEQWLTPRYSSPQHSLPRVDLADDPYDKCYTSLMMGNQFPLLFKIPNLHSFTMIPSVYSDTP